MKVTTVTCMLIDVMTLNLAYFYQANTTFSKYLISWPPRHLGRKWSCFSFYTQWQMRLIVLVNIRDAPLDIFGGAGSLEFLLLANFFFYLQEKIIYFFGDQRSTIFFFMFRRRNFLSYAFPIMYVTIWCFFWSTDFSSISTTNFFFLPTFFFWLLKRQTFFSIFF